MSHGEEALMADAVKFRLQLASLKAEVVELHKLLDGIKDNARSEDDANWRFVSDQLDSLWRVLGHTEQAVEETVVIRKLNRGTEAA